MDFTHNYNFEYLKPPQEVFNIVHSSYYFLIYLLKFLKTGYYIKHGDGVNHVRKIFTNVTYDEFETNFLNEFKKHLAKNNLSLPET